MKIVVLQNIVHKLNGEKILLGSSLPGLFLAGLLLLGLSLLGQGCAVTHRAADLETVPLPQPSSLDCCWQSSQQVVIEHGGNELSLSTVLLAESSLMRMVMFDPLGRKLFMLEHLGDEPKVTRYLTSAISPESKAESKPVSSRVGLSDAQALNAVPIQWVIPAVYLTHGDLAQWLLSASPWSVAEEKAPNAKSARHAAWQRPIRTLYFKGRPIIVSTPKTLIDDDSIESWHVEFVEQGIQLQIKAGQKQMLSAGPQ